VPRRPRYIALKKADTAYGLPVGLTGAWLTAGYVDRVYFVDHGEIVVGVKPEQMHHLVARVRARRVALHQRRVARARGRAAGQGATVR
jgi:hypothetical protein